VKSLRLFLLLLMAVLLPLRSAIAAAVPCAGLEHSVPAMHVHAMAAGHAAAALPGQSQQPTSVQHAAPQHHEHAASDKCSLCASCCSATPMPATFSFSVAAPERRAANFPALDASSPTFLSEGPERPPRSV
jgi:uncharacterized protein involved in copper resistance